MIQKALEIGIKPAARLFHTSPPLVRNWLKRFKSGGYSGLNDRSQRPHNCPNETPSFIKKRVSALKAKYKRLGAEQIKILENLSLAPKTIRKIWREAGVASRKKPKKHITKNNLRAVKKL